MQIYIKKCIKDTTSLLLNVSERRMKPTEFRTQAQGLSCRHIVQQFPKTGTMVHLPRVGQFVQYNIINQVRGYQHQIAGKTDGASRRATAPPRTGTRNPHLPVGEAETFGPYFQQGRQKFRGHFLQGPHNGCPYQLLHGLIRKSVCAGQNTVTSPEGRSRTVKHFNWLGSSDSRKQSASIRKLKSKVCWATRRKRSSKSVRNCSSVANTLSVLL